VTKIGQLNYMKTLTQHVIAAGGSGIMYWEPAWVNSSLGFGQEITSFFDFNSNVMTGIDYMNYNYNFN